MPVVEEEGYEFDLPDERWFRFEDCETYQKLSSQHLKEMDFGWTVEGADGTAHQLWLLEAKNVRNEGAQRFSESTDGHRFVDVFVDELVCTFTDALLMVAAAWSATEVGTELRSDILRTCRDFPSQPVPLFTVIALRIERVDTAPLYDLLRARLQKQLEGRLNLLGSTGVFLAILRTDRPTTSLPIRVEPVG